MKKRIVIAGAGHAHMVALARLDEFIAKGFAVTVIGPSQHHYYSGMGPGMLGGFYAPEEIRFNTRRMVEKNGGVFLCAKVVRIDAPAGRLHLDTGDRVAYDVLSCNLGSRVPRDAVQGDLTGIYRVKPIERLLEARLQIQAASRQKRLTIGIAGGGPSAVEIAGNVWRLTNEPGLQPAEIRLFAGGILMPNHPAGVRRRALKSLQSRGIEIVENNRVTGIQTGALTGADGRTHPADIIFVAVGVKPSPVFAASGLPTGPDGGLKVNPFLQSTKYPNIFGGGDCIYFEPSPLDKVGVYAVRQNPVLFHNLMAAAEDRPLKTFSPGGKYLLIFNLGDGGGILHKWGIQFGGRMAFALKDRIDRKFMRRFQQFE